MHYFHPHAPEIQYVQNEENNICFSIVEYDCFCVNEHVAEHAVLSQI